MSGQHEALNVAFGAKPGGVPGFRAESEGDDYLFGLPPQRRARAAQVVAALAALDKVDGDLEKLDPASVDVLARAAAELEHQNRQERR